MSKDLHELLSMLAARASDGKSKNYVIMELKGHVNIHAHLTIREDQWTDFLSRCVKGGMQLAIDTGTICHGCQAKELYSQIHAAIAADELEDKGTMFLMQAIGLVIAETGTMPFYGNMQIDIEHMVKLHDEDGATKH